MIGLDDVPDAEGMTQAVLDASAALRPYRWEIAAETAATPELRRVAEAARDLVEAVDRVARS